MRDTGAPIIPAQRAGEVDAGRPSPPAAPSAGWRHDWRSAIVAGLAVWVGSRLGAVALTLIMGIHGETSNSPGRLAYRWVAKFDAGYFIGIADGWYKRTADHEWAAIFPGYPIIIKVFAPLFLGKEWLAALFVSNMALLVLLIVLYRMVEHEFGDGAAAGRAIFYLVAFPTAFFLTGAYNEGFFIALIVGSVYCMRRGHWWLAGLFGLYAAMTRSAGILLVLAFAYEYLRTHGRRPRPNVLAGALIPVGLGIVMLINELTFGDPMAFSKAQTLHWGREWHWPWVAILDSAKIVFAIGPDALSLNWIWVGNALEFGTTLLALIMVGLALAGPWRMRRDQLVLPLFGLALILFMVSFPSRYEVGQQYPLLSNSRIGMEVFPAFMMLGRLGRHAWLDRTVVCAGLLMQGLLAFRHLQGGWVA